MQSKISIQALKAVNHASGSEQTRYYLVGVQLTIAARHAMYVATDGHVMVCHREDLHKDAPDNELLGSWIVPADVIKKLKPARIANKESFAAAGEGRFIIDATGAETIFKPVDGTLPPWERVITAAVDYSKPVHREQFNPDIFAVFGKVAKGLDISAGAVNLHSSNMSGAPAAVTFGPNRQTFGVIMPVHGNGATWSGLPVWAGGAEPAPVAQAAE